MISLDTTLSGEQLHVRKSMTKYVANEDWKDIELCGAGYRPLRLFLNHQFIKILEDLGIPAKNFLQVQDDARKELERIIRHPLNAASFLGMLALFTKPQNLSTSLFLSFEQCELGC